MTGWIPAFWLLIRCAMPCRSSALSRRCARELSRRPAPDWRFTRHCGSCLNALVTDLIDEVRLARAWARRNDAGRDSRAPRKDWLRSARIWNLNVPQSRNSFTRISTTRPAQEQEHARGTGGHRAFRVHLMADPSLMPQDHQAQVPTEGLARTVADYIAGMTDSYIVQLWRRYSRG